MAAKITVKQLSEQLEKLTQELASVKKDVAGLKSKTNSNDVTISRFKVYIEDKLKPVDIEAEVKKLMGSKEAILIGLKNTIVPMTQKQHIAAVYKEYKQKQKENGKTS